MGRLGYCVPCGEDRNPVDATVMVDGDPMCQAHAGAAARRENRAMEATAPVAATEQEPSSEERKGEERATMNTGRISDEIRAKVKAEFGTMSNEALGRKYGISGVSVGSICKGIEKKPHEREPAKRVIVAEAPQCLSQGCPDSSSLPGVGARVTLHVPEAALDRLLLAVSAANKARAVQFLIDEGAV